MQVSVGDRVLIHGRTVGMPERHGEVIEIRGHEGEPLLVVRYDDGREGFLAPGSDCEIQHAAEA